MTPGTLLLQAAAIAASLFGYLVLAPGFMSSLPKKQLSIGEGLALLSVAVVFAWWPVAITAAASGVRGALVALVILDVAWALVAQGAAGFAFCAIPRCPDFAPWPDVARYGSAFFGAIAAWTAWRAYRAKVGPTQWAPAITATLLTVVSFALQAANSGS